MKAEEKSVEQIRRGLRAYGQDKVDIFQTWVEMFEAQGREHWAEGAASE